jgi:hypothetical protein
VSRRKGSSAPWLRVRQARANGGVFRRSGRSRAVSSSAVVPRSAVAVAVSWEIAEAMEDVVLNCSACPRDLSPGMVRPEQPDPQCLLFQRLSVRHATATTSSPSVSGKCSEVPSNSGICRPFADRGRTRRVASALEGVDGSSPSEGFEIREKPANRLVLLSESAPQGTSLTVEVRERHARTRATTRDTVSPANRAEWRLEDASRDVARVVSDVSVLCPRVVVEIGNDPTSLRPSRCSQRRGCGPDPRPENDRGPACGRQSQFPALTCTAPPDVTKRAKFAGKTEFAHPTPAG